MQKERQGGRVTGSQQTTIHLLFQHSDKVTARATDHSNAGETSFRQKMEPLEAQERTRAERPICRWIRAALCINL